MDEYSVGSLSDLITGSRTPNKPKVKKTKFIKKELENVNDSSTNGTENRSPKKSKKLKSFSKETKPESKQQDQKNESPIFKKPKKEKSNESFNIKNELFEVGPNENETSTKKEKKISKKTKLSKDKTEEQENKSTKIKKNKQKSNYSLKNAVEVIPSQNVEPTKKVKSFTKKTKTAENKPEGGENKTPKIKKNKRKLNEGLNSTGVEIDTNEIENPAKKVKLSANQENAVRRVKKQNKAEVPPPDPEVTARTLFVGNVPVELINNNAVEKFFKKFGQIESVRFRSIAVADPKLSKKVALIKNELNPKRSSVNCYVIYSNKESVKSAESANGEIFHEHRLRVHACTSESKPDESKAIFVGNISFDAEDDELWKLFETCGSIDSVRIVRDRATGMGKGFGYVNFKDSDAVQLALEMENVKLKNRELRIKLSNLNQAQKNKKKNINKEFSSSTKPKARYNKKTNEYQKGKNENTGPRFGNSQFQGTKFTDKKKKLKFNKGLMERKKLIKQIAPKPK